MNETTIRISQERAALAHLKLAKQDVESGDTILARADELYRRAGEFYRKATEHMAKAQENGASQRRIANYLGKSPAWVNRLLRWRKSGYQDTPFGPQSKAGRERARVQAAERTKATKKSRTKTKHDDLAAAVARAKAAQAEAAKTKADAERLADEAIRLKADAIRLKAEALREQIRADRARARAAGATFTARSEHVLQSGLRKLLVKALGMLGSDHAGERANAASVAERQRDRIGMTWDELLIPASDSPSSQMKSHSDEAVA